MPNLKKLYIRPYSEDVNGNLIVNKDYSYKSCNSWDFRKKIAVLKSICYIIAAHEEITPLHMEFITNYIKNYELDASAIQKQAEMPKSEMGDILRHSAWYDKKIILEYWVDVTDVHSDAVHAVCDLCNYCYIS